MHSLRHSSTFNILFLGSSWLESGCTLKKDCLLTDGTQFQVVPPYNYSQWRRQRRGGAGHERKLFFNSLLNNIYSQLFCTNPSNLILINFIFQLRPVPLTATYFLASEENLEGINFTVLKYFRGSMINSYLKVQMLINYYNINLQY